MVMISYDEEHDYEQGYDSDYDQDQDYDQGYVHDDDQGQDEEYGYGGPAAPQDSYTFTSIAKGNLNSGEYSISSTHLARPVNDK